MFDSPLCLGMRASILFTNDTFAYWFDSDVGVHPESDTPIVGKYSVNGWRVNLCPEDDKVFLYSIDWYVFCHDGCLTLMPGAQYRMWQDSGRYDASRLLWHFDSFVTNDPLARMSTGFLFAGGSLTFQTGTSRNGIDGPRLLTFHVKARNSGDVEDVNLMDTTNGPSRFTGTIPTVVGNTHPSNGVLELQERDIVSYDVLLVHKQEFNIATSIPPSELPVLTVKRWRWGEPSPPGGDQRVVPTK